LLKKKIINENVTFNEIEEILKERVLIENNEHSLRKKHQKLILKFMKITHQKLSSLCSCLMERPIIVEKAGEKKLIEDEKISEKSEKYRISTDLSHLKKKNSHIIEEKMFSILYSLRTNSLEYRHMSKVLILKKKQYFYSILIKKNRIQTKIFQSFLIENGIDEAISDYYPMAIVKERAYFFEAIFLNGINNFFIVLKYTLNEHKYPEKVNEEMSIDKSKFVIGKKLYAKIKKSKRKSD
jgi:hypothetical protein